MEKFFLIGIKGTGMSALAQILYDLGNEVYGSDVSTYFFTQKELDKRHIEIYPYNENNIKPGLTVILGNAFDENQIEYKKAKELGLKTYTYREYLNILAQKTTSIAVTGTHGKTSTTNMLVQLFDKYEYKNVSCLIGDGTGFAKKNPELFIFEACEYYRHFLSYKPDYAIVTNVDFDHPDYYKNEEDVLDAFQSFVDNVKKVVVYCGDDQYARKLKSKSAKMISYGLGEDNDYVAKEIKTHPEKGTVFTVYKYGEHYYSFFFPIFGLHELKNILSVIAMADIQGIEPSKIQKALKYYENAKRRFSEYEFKGNIIVDDYAHHPKEIEATIDTARRKYPDKRVVAIFQPHTYTRTEKFLDAFAESLKKSDKVFLYDIFGSAREKSGHVTIEDLAKKISKDTQVIKKNNGKFKTFQTLREEFYGKEVLLFMGAGDINKLRAEFIKFCLEN